MSASLGIAIWRVVLLIVLLVWITIATILARLHPFLAMTIAASVYGSSLYNYLFSDFIFCQNEKLPMNSFAFLMLHASFQFYSLILILIILFWMRKLS